MRVVLSVAAYEDLLDIGQNIKKDNPIRAESFVGELYDCCQKLSLMPHAYPLLLDWENMEYADEPMVTTQYFIV